MTSLYAILAVNPCADNPSFIIRVKVGLMNRIVISRPITDISFCDQRDRGSVQDGSYLMCTSSIGPSLCEWDGKYLFGAAPRPCESVYPSQERLLQLLAVKASPPDEGPSSRAEHT